MLVSTALRPCGLAPPVHDLVYECTGVHCNALQVHSRYITMHCNYTCNISFLFVHTGQFDTQNCYQGKFGDEIASDQFGGQVMLHPRKNHPGMKSNISIMSLCQFFN